MAHADLLCPICSEKLNPNSQIEYLNLTGETLFLNKKIQVCDNCEFGFTLPELDTSELESFYKISYRNKFELLYDTISPTFNPFTYSARAISQILLLREFRNFKKNDTILDIGAGNGILLHTLKMLGEKTNFFAIEPDIRCHTFLKNSGAKIFPIFFNKDTAELLKDIKFNFIILSHILEHSNGSDIVPLLKTTKKMLSNDGICLCEVPFSYLKETPDYRLNDYPHLTFFNKNIVTVFEKSGFEVLYSDTAGKLVEKRWQEELIFQKKSKAIGSSLEHNFKKFINTWPDFISKRLKYISNWHKFPNIYKILSDDNFQYGGDRECIRLIAK